MQGTTRGDDGTPLPHYTEDELDALYERDPAAAMRISRLQAMRERESDRAGRADPLAPAPTAEQIDAVLQEARQVLRRDGGDLELVGLEDGILTVRMAGNCAGCPRAALDLKNVVERLVRARLPGVVRVRNAGRLP